jgi:hypothetical protein
MGEVSTMIQQLLKAALTGMIMLVSISAFAQYDEKCRGPIYSGSEVAQRAKITEPADIASVFSMLGNNGRAVVDTVLCRSGHVTDIKVVEISDPKVAQFVIMAVSLIQFKPAERNWHTVSERRRFEYGITPSPVNGAQAGGRLIEEIDVMGNRRLTKDEVMSWIKSRPGEVFDNAQVQKDLQAILAIGSFDAESTRVLMEDALRGGVRLIFELHELPLIAEVRFEGLKESEKSGLVEELQKNNAGVQKGVPFDAAKLKKAREIIRTFFEAKGWRGVTVEPLIDQISATEVTIIFRINGYRFP